MRAAYGGGAMKRRLLLGVFLIATLLSLRPLVFASGLEHTWIPGVYDAGDTDDALALSSFKAIGPGAPPMVRAANVRVSALAAASLADPESRTAVAAPSRAPPRL
jgi:hypothetical protein